MFSQLIEKRELSTIGDASAFARWLIDNTGGDTSSGVNVSEGNSLTLPYVYACINVLSQTLAHVPLELLKTTAKGADRATRHYLWNLVRYPHHEYGSYDWRETLEGHRNGWGNGYARIVRDGAQVVSLPLMFPDRTEARRLDRDRTLVYESEIEGREVRLLASDVLHFAGIGFDGITGYSPIHQAREAVGIGLAIHKYGGSFFGKGGTPKGVIESEVPANALGAFADEFRKNFGSLDQAQGTPVLPKGLTYKSISINPDDAQTLETLKFNRTEICGMFRVPPQFVMDLERSTFTNAVEMDTHFVKHTMSPIFAKWEAELNRKLLTDSERRRGYYFKFNDAGLLRGSTKERFDAYHVALQDGWLSRNEVRIMEDMPQQEELEEFLVPNNMVGTDEPTASEPQEQPAPAPEPEDDEEEQEEDEQRFQPLVQMISERIASKERRYLERAKGDGAKLAALYGDELPKFIKRTARPLAEVMVASPDEFVENFAKEYIERQKTQAAEAESVTEKRILETFYEVVNGY